MDCIIKMRQQLEKIWPISEVCEVESTDRKRFVSSMLFVALSHCDAIQLLSQHQNFASAYALLRSMMETSFRAVWLHRYATEKEAKKCEETDKWMSPRDLVKEIERYSGLPPIMSNIWQDYFPVIHSFTHGGVQIAYRQLGDRNFVTPHLPKQEISQLMFIIGFFSLTILRELIDLAEATDQCDSLEELTNEFNLWSANTYQDLNVQK